VGWRKLTVKKIVLGRDFRCHNTEKSVASKKILVQRTQENKHTDQKKKTNKKRRAAAQGGLTLKGKAQKKPGGCTLGNTRQNIGSRGWLGGKGEGREVRRVSKKNYKTGWPVGRKAMTGDFEVRKKKKRKKTEVDRGQRTTGGRENSNLSLHPWKGKAGSREQRKKKRTERGK